MNSTQIAQIATFLNVAPNQIKRAEEWANVLFVQVHGCRPRFVSKKVIMQPNTFSGKWYPGMPEFSEPEDEFTWLDNYEAANGLDLNSRLNVAIADIAKHLPMGYPVSNAVLERWAYQVIDGTVSAQDAATKIASKKIIIRK